MKCTTTQGFGPSTAYKPLKGHPGKDRVCGFLSPIYAEFDGYVYKTFTLEDPASDGFTAICQIVETAQETFEFIYGHPNVVLCSVGQFIRKGQLIGLEGNQGFVMVNGRIPTDEERKKGVGSHRHYQKRLVKKVSTLDPSKKYLDQRLPNNVRGYQYCDDAGFFYEVVDHSNGYNGCVDFDLPSEKDALELEVSRLTKLRNLYLELKLLYQKLNKAQ